MSSYGRSGLSRWMFGSVAEKVLRHAPCHLLIIRARVESNTFTRQRILVPLDGSQMAEQALMPAVSLAVATKAELLLLRAIVSGKAALDAADRSVLYGDIEARERREAEAYLHKTVTSLADAHDAIKIHVVAGHVAETIVDTANERQTGLIVMSSHGRSGLSRWLYGSIAEKVLHGARCAALVIPMRKSASAAQEFPNETVVGNSEVVNRRYGEQEDAARILENNPQQDAFLMDAHGHRKKEF